MLSDVTQAAIFGEASRETATLGLIRVAYGVSPEAVRQRLRADLSDEAAVLDKDDLLERERTDWQRHDPFLRLLGAGGPALTIVCGLFCWWLLFRLQQPQRRDFTILRLIGYERGFLLRVLAAEVAFVVLQAGVPALIVTFCLQPVLRYWTGLPVSFRLGQASLWLAASACVFGLLAVARGLRWQRNIEQDLQSCL